jgi:hypothetical protein
VHGMIPRLGTRASRLKAYLRQGTEIGLPEEIVRPLKDYVALLDEHRSLLASARASTRSVKGPVREPLLGHDRLLGEEIDHPVSALHTEGLSYRRAFRFTAVFLTAWYNDPAHPLPPNRLTEHQVRLRYQRRRPQTPASSSFSSPSKTSPKSSTLTGRSSVCENESP